ncbi:HypC/HybG/HupF family hydrogenase formation chaperone [ANME-1 cluster archaeon GoMg4]|jgi:hydrogenase expression/formation protein HypC|nr:HypC/HybG/HupF family hydrogenase formation chaperone [ANME-1 cluster archaeon GoMg4]
MCLAIPAKVVEISSSEEGVRRKAKADFGGVSREIDISLVDVNIGDYVIVHAGFAIEIIDEQEAKETLKIWQELIEKYEALA